MKSPTNIYTAKTSINYLSRADFVAIVCKGMKYNKNQLICYQTYIGQQLQEVLS